MLQNLSVVGVQWGDEGKGKVVDYCTSAVDVVVRFAGGNNAGHTLLIDGQKIALHLLPSGAAYPDKVCVLGSGMVIDPWAFFEELGVLEGVGVKLDPVRLRVSGRAHLVLPYHRQLDELFEQGDRAIGTTRRGIGPAYQDKAARRGLRVCDLADRDRLAQRLRHAVAGVSPTIRGLGGTPPDADALIEQLWPLSARLAPYIDDTEFLLHQLQRDGKRLLLEGAQGVMLDIDHGTYPFVTSSAAIAGGACSGAGVPPQSIGNVIGVCKAYTTRVGEGPFPSEADRELADRLRQAGGEYGATTGRPRRCGWLDLPALRHAVRVAGVSSLALTKLDVLAGWEAIPVCEGYRLAGQVLERFPADASDLANVEPIIRELRGFDRLTGTESRFEELPETARAFVQWLEDAVGVPVALVSVGGGRNDTILRQAL